MKKILKSIGLCLGLLVLNVIMTNIVSSIFAVFTKNPNELNQNLYTLVFIGDLITLILVHYIFLDFNKKILSKDIFKKISMKDTINISLFGIGCSAVLLILSGILSQIFPDYKNVVNQIQLASNYWSQLILAIVLIPIYEEIFFRRVIFGYLREKYNLIGAVIGQALVFGFAHGNIVQGIYTFILGIALALIYVYSESLVGSIIVHIIFNLLGILVIPKLIAINPAMIYLIIIFGIVCIGISISKIFKKYENILY
ncbi:CPBP family intramembrane glutamic endopeptidase [Paraclostridium sordellii]|uniref:CPBP family intramembrane glutamic endopeptidase n=1 Tax=Paraclostridium sordellii TaxID=1505 RepID=UPI0005E74A42|nr:type II CAAX endopeptidase family protein [Paeniclostridium sordellii]CEN92721.1 CAAX amino terminal protease family protein [[Clostridium] sordellii] [Paeniclostridium sordellii]CEN96477.1 CAAX amino terminal protease family protein [[Clostridium] sordellii] [Paeniclostridium sordellii]